MPKSICPRNSLARAVLSGYAHFEVLLRRGGNTFTEKFCKLRCVLCLLVGCLFPIHTDLGIALAEGNACHRKIHTDFGAFAVEVGTKTFDDLHRNAVKCADLMLGRVGHFAVFNKFLKLFTGNLAKRAFVGANIALNDFAAYSTSPFFHK